MSWCLYFSFLIFIICGIGGWLFSYLSKMKKKKTSFNWEQVASTICSLNCQFRSSLKNVKVSEKFREEIYSLLVWRWWNLSFLVLSLLLLRSVGNLHKKIMIDFLLVKFMVCLPNSFSFSYTLLELVLMMHWVIKQCHSLTSFMPQRSSFSSTTCSTTTLHG